MLSLLRHVAFYDRDVKAGNWHFTSSGTIRRVSEMTLGILGLGRIGKRMAYIAGPSFKRVIACDPYIIDGDFPANVERVSLNELLARSDALSLHVPLTAETRGIIGREQLAKMKPDSVLVKTSRGPVVDIDALLDGLNRGQPQAAALDVLPIEPPPTDAPIVQHPRVLLSPHAAFYSDTAERELRRKAAQNLIDWAQTGRPTYGVAEGQNNHP